MYPSIRDFVILHRKGESYGCAYLFILAADRLSAQERAGGNIEKILSFPFCILVCFPHLTLALVFAELLMKSTNCKCWLVFGQSFVPARGFRFLANVDRSRMFDLFVKVEIFLDLHAEGRHDCLSHVLKCEGRLSILELSVRAYRFSTKCHPAFVFLSRTFIFFAALVISSSCSKAPRLCLAAASSPLNNKASDEDFHACDRSFRIVSAIMAKRKSADKATRAIGSAKNLQRASMQVSVPNTRPLAGAVSYFGELSIRSVYYG